MAFWCVTKARSGQIHALAQKYHLWLDWIVLLSPHHISFLVSLILILSKCCQVTLHRLLYDHQTFDHPALWSSRFNQLQFLSGIPSPPRRCHLPLPAPKFQPCWNSITLAAAKTKKGQKALQRTKVQNWNVYQMFPNKGSKNCIQFSCFRLALGQDRI